jgi:hypothetical protein
MRCLPPGASSDGSFPEGRRAVIQFATDPKSESPRISREAAWVGFDEPQRGSPLARPPVLELPTPPVLRSPAHMRGAIPKNRQAQVNAFILWKQSQKTLLVLSVLLGVTLFFTACQGGGSDASDSGGGGGLGGGLGLAGSGNSEATSIDSDALLDSAQKAAALSDDDLNAAIAAADLDLQVALAQKSGLSTELGGDAATRATLAAVGFDMELAAELLAAGALFDGQEPQSAPKTPLFDLKKPGVPLLADDGGGSLGEAFGAGWLGGSLFNGAFVDLVVREYSDGKSGTENYASGDITAHAGLSDTLVTIDATANFKLNSLSATIKTHSGIPCPDSNGLMTVNSSLDITGQAGDASQSARFSFELIVEVDSDAKLTGKNQLTSRTQTNVANATNGWGTPNGSVDISITEFSDGKFGNAKGSYKGMTEKEMLGWMGMGMMSGEIYRRQLLPHLQTMLEAGRCVDITVESSAGPLNLDPSTNVDLLTKPRAKTDGRSTGGRVQATFKTNAGGNIAELGSKVKADATFHYTAPIDHQATEVVTFEARSKRGTGKLDYKLTTSPHAD